MSDLTQNPYAGAKTKKERQAIYQGLLLRHENDVEEYERKRTIYDGFISIWDKQRKIQLEADNRFHKNILTIAAGSFGVSFAFINQIVPLKSAVHPAVLVLSWLFFGLSIVFAVLEPRVGSVIQDKLLDDIEENIELGYEGRPYKETRRWLLMLPTRILNWLSFILFAMGVVCLIFFVYLNMAAR
ncbi:MAG: hypothetical protein LBB72_02370 [Spirochaetaceae bacterium]|jgi:hypothetical protein|nr:hypothetical protein [Spirochaetaceae bacterium]